MERCKSKYFKTDFFFSFGPFSASTVARCAPEKNLQATTAQTTTVTTVLLVQCFLQSLPLSQLGRGARINSRASQMSICLTIVSQISTGIILDCVCICNNTDDRKQKEAVVRARRHFNTSTEPGCSCRKNTCAEILRWKSKEIIWANRHFIWLDFMHLEHLKCLLFISLFLADYGVHEALCRTPN